MRSRVSANSRRLELALSHKWAALAKDLTRSDSDTVFWERTKKLLSCSLGFGFQASLKMKLHFLTALLLGTLAVNLLNSQGMASVITSPTYIYAWQATWKVTAATGATSKATEATQVTSKATEAMEATTIATDPQDLVKNTQTKPPRSTDVSESVSPSPSPGGDKSGQPQAPSRNPPSNDGNETPRLEQSPDGGNKKATQAPAADPKLHGKPPAIGDIKPPLVINPKNPATKSSAAVVGPSFTRFAGVLSMVLVVFFVAF